jgi:hypothetical protein
LTVDFHSVAANRFRLELEIRDGRRLLNNLRGRRQRCGRLHFELPLDITDEEIAYIKSLVPGAQSGLLELVDPATGEVVFCCTPVLVHQRDRTP